MSKMLLIGQRDIKFSIAKVYANLFYEIRIQYAALEERSNGS